jgi:hypothetical protein
MVSGFFHPGIERAASALQFTLDVAPAVTCALPRRDRDDVHKFAGRNLLWC